jgi:hypothetical protein
LVLAPASDTTWWVGTPVSCMNHQSKVVLIGLALEWPQPDSRSLDLQHLVLQMEPVSVAAFVPFLALVLLDVLVLAFVRVLDVVLVSFLVLVPVLVLLVLSFYVRHVRHYPTQATLLEGVSLLHVYELEPDWVTWLS